MSAMSKIDPNPYLWKGAFYCGEGTARKAMECGKAGSRKVGEGGVMCSRAGRELTVPSTQRWSPEETILQLWGSGLPGRDATSAKALRQVCPGDKGSL